MSTKKRISLSLPAELVESFDEYFSSRGITNRSQACELIFGDYLAHARLSEAERIVGMLMVVYDNHKLSLLTKLNSIQHEFKEVISSSQHLHLDSDRCLEAIFVQGRGQRIQMLSDKLLATKGISLGRSLLNIV